MKGNSLHPQEQLSNGCLVWKGLQVPSSLCHHSPQGTVPWALGGCVRAQLQGEPWVQAGAHRKCPERLQRSYLLSLAMVVYFGVNEGQNGSSDMLDVHL